MSRTIEQIQHSYRYLLCFSSDSFPESEGPPEGIHSPYYDPSYLDYYGWKRKQETKTR
jgi:hypothetical protein